MKQIRYFIEALALYLFYGICKLIGANAASGLGGFIGRTIGPRLAASRKAYTNLRNALPNKSDAEYDAIIKGMWDNLGRVLAEYPHLAWLAQNNVELVGQEYIEQARDDGLPAIFFSGHIGNWEIMSAVTTLNFDMECDVIYRAPNNPMADKLLNHARSLKGKIGTIAKSTRGAREFMNAMKNGHHIGLLIDQKYNEGISIPFFGRPAMTSPAFVQMCQKFKCPLVPVYVERLQGAHFRMTALPPMEIEGKEIEEAIAEAHHFLEECISKRPEQWLWLHRRWSDRGE